MLKNKEKNNEQHAKKKKQETAVISRSKRSRSPCESLSPFFCIAIMKRGVFIDQISRACPIFFPPLNAKPSTIMRRVACSLARYELTKKRSDVTTTTFKLLYAPLTTVFPPHSIVRGDLAPRLCSTIILE